MDPSKQFDSDYQGGLPPQVYKSGGTDLNAQNLGTTFSPQLITQEVQPLAVHQDLKISSPKTGAKRKRTENGGSRKRRKIDPKDKRYKEIIVRFIFRNLDRPIHSTYVSKCATHKKNATVVKAIFWELHQRGYGICEKWRDTENSSLFFYKNEKLNEKNPKEFDERLLNRLCSEYTLERSDVSDGFRVKTKGPSFKEKINTGRWSKEEHEAFLRGLAEYGRTNYRLISMNYVMTRITQQVAEYSERYFAAKRKKEKERQQEQISPQPLISEDPPQQSIQIISSPIVQMQQLQQLALMGQMGQINPQLAQQYNHLMHSYQHNHNDDMMSMLRQENVGDNEDNSLQNMSSMDDMGLNNLNLEKVMMQSHLDMMPKSPDKTMAELRDQQYQQYNQQLSSLANLQNLSNLGNMNQQMNLGLNTLGLNPIQLSQIRDIQNHMSLNLNALGLGLMKPDDDDKKDEQ